MSDFRMAPGDAPLPGTVEIDHHTPGLAVVSMRGEHDISTAPELEQALEQAAAHSDVLVDLSECEFIDSTAIGLLIRTAKQVQARDEQLVVVIPGESSNVAQMARLVRLAEIMPVKTSRGDALASLEGPQPPAPPDPATERP
jgi:anti-sigma B factor antagonist